MTYTWKEAYVLNGQTMAHRIQGMRREAILYCKVYLHQSRMIEDSEEPVWPIPRTWTICRVPKDEYVPYRAQFVLRFEDLIVLYEDTILNCLQVSSEVMTKLGHYDVDDERIGNV